MPILSSIQETRQQVLNNITDLQVGNHESHGGGIMIDKQESDSPTSDQRQESESYYSYYSSVEGKSGPTSYQNDRT